MPRCPSCQAELAPKTLICPHDGTALTPSLEGEILGERYRIMRELGEGGMGRVYLAEHVILGKQLAVKVLRAEFSKLPDLVKRFQLEAVAASQIGQENIVDVTDFGQTPDGSFYFVMEYVPGKSLAQLIDKDGAMPARRALPIMLQVSKALGAAHGRGIIHRDMKPDNVLVTPSPDGHEHAKVLDFGISKVGEGSGTKQRITQVGMVVGTPHYMAPEQATGQAIDLRVDIYAFGILFYELVTGKVPFDGEHSLQILMKHQKDPVQAPRARRPDLEIPPSVEALILRCLEKDRGNRPQSMGEVGHLIASCMAELGLVSGPSSLGLEPRTTDPAGVATTSGAPRTTEPGLPPQATDTPILAEAVPGELTTGERKAVQRRLGALWVVLGATLAIALIVGMVWLGRGTPTPQVDKVVITQPTTPAKNPFANIDSIPAEQKPAPIPTQPAVAIAPAPRPVPALHTEPVHAVAKPAKVAVTLRSSPSGAQVLGPAGPLGPTPLRIDLDPGESRAVRVQADGYREERRTVRAGDGEVTVELKKIASARDVAKAPATSSPDGEPYGKVDDLKDDPYAK